MVSSSSAVMSLFSCLASSHSSSGGVVSAPSVVSSCPVIAGGIGGQSAYACGFCVVGVERVACASPGNSDLTKHAYGETYMRFESG
eukprot:2183172-Pleurochrysis_carterae.AAC.2